MRTDEDVAAYRVAMTDEHGDDSPIGDYKVSCYDACIPRSFWSVASSDVTFNTDVFQSIVVPYRKRHKQALRHGYSLLFLGDNGVGKTMFISYLLTQMIKRGFTAYYTTMMQLDIDIKRGFNSPEMEKRLRYMLESDFVAIDEVGKERFKSDGYLAARLEHLLKQRYDDREPVLLGANIAYDDLVKMYGSTIESMLQGKYQAVAMEPGDWRRAHKKQMRKKMGYK